MANAEQYLLNAKPSLAESNGAHKEDALLWLVQHGVSTILCDLESTLEREEAFQRWGDMIGVNGELGAITRNVQDGRTPFHEGVADRLCIAQPTVDMVEDMSRRYVSHRVPYALEFIRGLRMIGKDVQIVSMGFQNVMKHFREMTGVPMHGGKLYFDRHEKYTGYADGHLLSQANGKNMFVDALREQGKIRGSIAMIGDGMTDMAVCGPGVVRIGFGGVEARESVRKEADIFAYDLASIFVIVMGEKNWQTVMHCRDEGVRQMLTKGMLAIINGEVEFKDKALEIALRDRIVQFINRACAGDRDRVVYQYAVCN